MFGPDSFFLEGSYNRNARLWTSEAKFLSTFGQENRWHSKKSSPGTYSTPWNHIQGERKDNKKKRVSTKQSLFGDGQLFNPSEPLRYTEQEAVETSKQASSHRGSAKNSEREPKHPREPQLPRIDQPQQRPRSQAPSEDTVQNRVTTPYLSSVLNQRKYESIFKRNLEEGLLKRIARRKVRRRVFGEIDAKKVNQFGTACSPFRALATTEMETFTLPSNLPMTSRMVSRGLVCTTESDLKTMKLTFPEVEEENAEETKPSDKKNALDQTKKSMLPPLLHPTRSRLSENKKTSGFRLPSVPIVKASTSLKWGKY
ncbi:uncharacterized protein LOC100554699 [Anolis carolinensis]|uniref:uncharacterized protein LOC100554699 n=1 Tax=Anolis carolinensis TaxID=28377 RepID=UPI000203A473|nr:PREDICTED: uncharacterized protein LOC100554699 [Anolis carolinensis]|eukprot:XP_003224748.1 PREDICTED: uncharacterized protein LOC100554699 [Anolis carolinensis]